MKQIFRQKYPNYFTVMIAPYDVVKKVILFDIYPLENTK